MKLCEAFVNGIFASTLEKMLNVEVHRNFCLDISNAKISFTHQSECALERKRKTEIESELDVFF